MFTKNRIFTPIDMFPTVLTAMGFEYEGNRLGLGTDMYSEQETIAEEIGYDQFNTQLNGYSNFYLDTFR